MVSHSLAGRLSLWRVPDPGGHFRNISNFLVARAKLSTDSTAAKKGAHLKKKSTFNGYPIFPYTFRSVTWSN